MFQQTYLSCPKQSYRRHVKAFEATKDFVNSKQESGECGTVVKGNFIIDRAFWWPAADPDDVESDDVTTTL